MKLDIPNLSLEANPRMRLSERLANAIRAAVRRGKLKPGDMLPSYPELARQIGTSVRVPREAVGLLVGEGLLASRRGFGTVVLKRHPSANVRERILLVHPNGHGAYYLGVLIEEIDRLITDAGYMVSRAAMRKREDGVYNFNLLNRLLRTDDFSAALVFAYDDKTIGPVAASGIPYAACTFRPIRYEGAFGRIDYSHRSAIPQLIRHCRAAKVKRILQVVTVNWLLDATDDLRAAGFDVESLFEPYPTADIGKQETVERNTFRMLDRWLRTHPLPDLILFTDDFATRGGILALEHCGIRYPEDVKLVAWSNRHFGPVAPISLTRMVMDPFAHARTVANAFLPFLRTGCFKKNARIGPTYVKGESFP